MNFKKLFVANYPDYVNKVLTKAPNLTQSEIRVCMYVKMNLSNKEILEKDQISLHHLSIHYLIFLKNSNRYQYLFYVSY